MKWFWQLLNLKIYKIVKFEPLVFQTSVSYWALLDSTSNQVIFENSKFVQGTYKEEQTSISSRDTLLENNLTKYHVV